MRMILIAAASALGCLAVAGCASVSSISQGQAPTVAQVQSDTQALCGFLPLAEDISSILTKNSASASSNQETGSQIAGDICKAAVASAQAKSLPLPAQAASSKLLALRRRAVPPIMRGLSVHGVFVNGTII